MQLWKSVHSLCIYAPAPKLFLHREKGRASRIIKKTKHYKVYATYHGCPEEEDEEKKKQLVRESVWTIFSFYVENKKKIFRVRAGSAGLVVFTECRRATWRRWMPWLLGSLALCAPLCSSFPGYCTLKCPHSRLSNPAVLHFPPPLYANKHNSCHGFIY